MANYILSKEIHKAFECTINHCYLSVEVWIKFEPYEGNGILLETSLNDKERNKQFLPAIKHGIEAGMSYLHLPGVRATLIDAFLGSKEFCDVAFSLAAALALREAVFSDNENQNLLNDTDWLKTVGLYSESESILGAYQRNKTIKEHPWAENLYELRSESKGDRLSILRDAAASGDELALGLLSHETDDQNEKFFVDRKRAILENNPFSLVEIGEYYYSSADSLAPIDQTAVELFITLGNAYMEWRESIDADWIEKMSKAYNQAWEYSLKLGISDKPYMSAFAERVGDAFSNRSEPFCNFNTAIQWYKKVRTGDWSLRTKIALLNCDQDECLHLGDCYANGIPPIKQDLKMAEQLYQCARMGALSKFHNRSVSGEKAKYGQEPIEAMIEEKLGDLYSLEGGVLYNLDMAYNCYRTAANGSDTAKTKTLQVMRKQKEQSANGR